ncbi:2Fe-2S iron-sulfur cluster binding domain-containing protein [Subsaximicrobium wynnwilliamsii]|uniref:2Fe-2S iron-sulfur cluster binding domain-containing protein n=1 Tax=Subsaximicrobium wynnwilliamsii TaxID=291179 RepID=A0A5C6ZL41_9FLAO|nr:2Fe-2S iron-sulfur cluster-binding protein [Subsaximicrobium wynnwilliamsii]TXD85396.1 2Fe-2S iron-sulfur cluster binding domain-containing protein [Subsaximicrobium wynnwilliamsii]TXD90749.1 2Fe-2S iron-sulfur cluster binding domain-containing protein [Subsaximicrobium wynnwilliamsii]TXE05256.1 2Fe-2S iron-sulfur cluster binding domain-containing protein [Subsaximicrobium wynnwilliamsii]
MAEFHNIKIGDIYKETDDTTVVTFDIPEELQDDFHFNQGQHLTLKTMIDGEDVRRSYSLCSSPLDKKWQVAVKLIPSGKFSTYINEQLKAGDTMEVMLPSGTFGVSVQPEAAKNYLFFAAGSGITPVLSMVKTHLLAEPKATCKLFYVNKTAKSIIFKEELEQLRNRFFGRLEIYYFLTREKRDIYLFNGRFDDEKMDVLTKTFIDIPDTSEVFLCGPEQMVNYVSNYLIAAGLPKDLVHFELFVSGLSEEDIERTARLSKQKVEGVKVTILDGGKEFTFTMTKDFDNILDAALGAGADLPFACKGGVCSTCKCQVKEGSVEMKVNYALEDKEVAQNYVLSCQSVPTSEKVVVDFDV